MDAAEEIKTRLSIEDVIGEYVQLKRAGRNWRGLSPFTNERSPSFMVSPEKQIWHDFSSGKGGNIFSFVMEMEGLDFKGALELLARKAGVELEKYRGSSSSTYSKDKEKLYELLDMAARFYQVQFSKNQVALSYIIKQRQFSKQTALDWRIGYAPNNGTALVDYLKTKGFSQNQLRSAGVVAGAYRGGIQDMFRGRITIPLADPQGRIIGFTARLLRDEPNAPKYINTPQTVLYDKSAHVFGLHFAKESIRKCNYAVVAEGNFDVIASHGVGVHQVVATAGTAVTQRHLKTLGRFTSDIRISFDQDDAGLQATERTIPIASRAGVTLGIITVPSGKDPDELIKKDPEIWKEIIQRPQYAVDWLIERHSKLHDITSAVGKRKLSDVMLPIIAQLPDQVEKDHYVARLAKLLDVSKEALLDKLDTQVAKGPQKRLKKPVVQSFADDKTLIEYVKTQDHILSLALYQGKLKQYLDPIGSEMLISEPAKHLLKFLKSKPEYQSSQARAEALRPITDYVKMLSVIYEELYQNLEEIELVYETERLQAHLIEQYVKVQKQRISGALQTADDTQTRILLEEVKRYDKLLKNNKGGI